MRHLTDFIDEHLPEVKTIWDILKVEIGQLNRERRFLAHGFMEYYLQKEDITTLVREKGQMVIRNQTVDEIKVLTNRLYHLNTGENGINGDFHILFKRIRINKWNTLVNDENKIISS